MAANGQWQMEENGGQVAVYAYTVSRVARLYLLGWLAGNGTEKGSNTLQMHVRTLAGAGGRHQ